MSHLYNVAKGFSRCFFHKKKVKYNVTEMKANVRNTRSVSLVEELADAEGWRWEFFEGFEACDIDDK